MTRNEAHAYMNGSTRAGITIGGAWLVGNLMDGWSSPWRTVLAVPLWIAFMYVAFGPVMRKPRA